MVGDDPVRRAARPVGIDAGQDRRWRGSGREKGRCRNCRARPAARRRCAQPHAGVDRRARQIDPLAARQGLELHEHEVPDLDEAVAIRVRRSRAARPELVTVVVENLRARPAGPVSPIAQKLSLVAMRMIRSSGSPGDLPPQIERLVIVVIDGDGELVRRQAEVARQQVPRVVRSRSP